MVSRRDFLKLAGIGAGAAFLSGCGSRSYVAQQDALLPPTPTPFVLPIGSPPPEIATPTPGLNITPSASPVRTATPKYAGRKLCFVLWDHQLARYAYRPRDLIHQVPQTVPLYSGESLHFNRSWIDYWRDILRLCNPGMKVEDFERGWKSLITSDRAFTNGTGPDTGHFALHPITCGGATHEMVTGEPEKHGMRIYTLKWASDPPPVPKDPSGLDMTRHFMATTGSSLRLPDGSYAVHGFPQFENPIVPLASWHGTDLIEPSRIKAVSDIQPPYNTWAGQMPTVGQRER